MTSELASCVQKSPVVNVYTCTCTGTSEGNLLSTWESLSHKISKFVYEKTAYLFKLKHAMIRRFAVFQTKIKILTKYKNLIEMLLFWSNIHKNKVKSTLSK